MNWLDRNFGTVMAVWTLFCFVLLVAMIVVAVHFIGKWW